ncbi:MULTISPECIES: ABC transporter ATP-binding protein [unclassified Mesorhizobium]|uniref:ABC transporter ATP-binding protein n=1 Tax=unclassified Mesorhizobium TaxID=325217 RepID=UPI00112E4E12|nr:MULTISPECIES: ABC transporter ATP-binding protein [unclassified Mesorhizobium]TPK58658.1 ABC transporter ATP-binding protein [Mesorhizobium sp. B2-5-1]TPM55662.1 ABC transporter ATP-binding protein [Mesorhizobium sp. B2-1-9]TPM81786.1 ABC transporter ATP-binding protein [Mesorhizobium sp. B2-1-4]TPN05915.1 ABC transporter ATP-binding protein [Mesorhizobium sp. B2-1-2]UCI13025.1 ABC transporter ATP-binding protein [Mesorhizobium sp. B2-1-1]
MLLASSKFDELRLDHMSRKFGSMSALSDVSLTVRKGEFIALLGPSGCGKSTALNCIAGLLSTTGGSIYLDDKRIDQLKPEDRGFGMVFQNYALFPHMTVKANIGFGLKMRGTPKAEITQRVDEALGLVRLETQGHKLPGQLSGGQQQRVAIARAIVIEPPLVLMDEPLSNLDAKLRIEMRAEIRRIHNQLGATTLYVTHDQDEALSLADRIVVLRDGRIRQVGAPRDLYESPDHLDVAEFMGYRNRLTGKVTRRDGDIATVEVGGVSLSGRVRDDLAVGAQAVIAARPDDVTVSDKGIGTLDAKVETIEYRGREFVGTARTEGGLELIFHASQAASVGNTVSLSIDSAHALIYAA